VNAYNLYLRNGGDWDLVLVGGGIQEQLLKDLSAKIPIGKIHIRGWGTYEDMPLYYGLASGFILPSLYEPWGLVVNEAMASGLPVLVSSKCGCVPELCWRGVNGFDFNPLYEDEIMKSMLDLSSLNSNQLKKMGEASQAIINCYSPEVMALSLSSCLGKFI